jgi:hypothetical protein
MRRSLSAAILLVTLYVPFSFMALAEAKTVAFVAMCSAPTGSNIAADTEYDRPEGSVTEAYDAEAKAYVSHPRNTHATKIVVYSDGTATESSDKSFVTNMRILGTINANAISMIDDGKNGDVGLVTLYPKDSILVYAGTTYAGWHKAIPTGYVYISHCKFPGGLCLLDSKQCGG